MTKNPERLIEQYLDRVRVYLPIDSEDVLVEIRTHLLNTAEEIGQGEVTAGSVTMAIERFGEPRRVANEYAGTGKRVGPVPVEYTLPLLRILLILIAICAAFIAGAVVVGVAFVGVFGELGALVNLPFNLVVMIVVNLLFVILIVGGISLYEDRDKPVTERTTLEGVFGFASDTLKPRPRWEGAAELVFGLVFGTVIFLPQIQILFKPSFLMFLNVFGILVLLEALMGLVYYLYGENNTTLVVKALLAMATVVLAMFLINLEFPLTHVYSFNGTEWELLELSTIASYFPESFPLSTLTSIGWSIFIFIMVVGNVWTILKSAMKVPMYLNTGRGWWWTGTWGKSKLFQRKFHEDAHTRQDGFTGQ